MGARADRTNGNVAVIRAFLAGGGDLVAAFNDDERARRIGAALRAVAHPRFELIDHDSPEFGAGPVPVEGFVPTWRRFLESWECLCLDDHEMHAIGNRVVVVSRVRGRSRHAGVPFEDRRAAIWTFRGDRVLRIDHYAKPHEALAAAGLLLTRPRPSRPRFAPAVA